VPVEHAGDGVRDQVVGSSGGERARVSVR
jgi:hypothetical protein